MLMAACAFIGTQHRDVIISKTSVFIYQHEYSKTAFSKKSVFEKMSFHRIRVNGGQNWRKKSLVFKRKRIRVHGV